jgi:hypothetical protein
MLYAVYLPAAGGFPKESDRNGGKATSCAAQFSGWTRFHGMTWFDMQSGWSYKKFNKKSRNIFNIYSGMR